MVVTTKRVSLFWMNQKSCFHLVTDIMEMFHLTECTNRSYWIGKMLRLRQFQLCTFHLIQRALHSLRINAMLPLTSQKICYTWTKLSKHS